MAIAFEPLHCAGQSRLRDKAGGTLDGGSSLGGVHEPFDRVDDRQEHR
jgi:hypothetical protein